jgi:TolB-like protein/DNA-binding SARP family transcriptional activator/Tfp pilus assembly protein PilF
MQDTVHVPALHDRGKERWRLRCFGDFALADPNGQAVVLSSRKARALIAYLALTEPHSAGREKIMALLWSDRGEEQARSSLRQLLVGLRPLATSNPQLISAQRESVALARDHLDTDIDALHRSASADDLASLAQALGHVHQDLFCDLDHADSALDEWLRVERARHMDELFDLVIRAGRRGLDRGRIEPVHAIAAQLQRIDPTHEGAAQLGLMADSAGGDMAAMHRRHQRLCEHLRRELDASPSRDTEALYASLAEAGPPKPVTRPPIAHSPPSDEGIAHSATRPGEGARGPFWKRALALGTMLATLSVGNSAGTPDAQVQVAAVAPTSLAVLPFTDLSPGRNNHWFAEGVAEEITSLLSTQPNIQVTGRSSVAMLGPTAGFEEARRRLGVSHLLEGSVRRQGDRVRVDVRLVRTSDGMQIWSQQFDRRLNDIFAVQDEVGNAVVGQLASAIGSGPTLARRSARTSNEVYDLYLRAHVLWPIFSIGSGQESERLLRRAILIDPNYAPAHAALAMNMVFLEMNRGTGPSQPQFAEARRLAARAIALDPNSGEAYRVLSFLEPNRSRKLALAQRAIELDPGNAGAWHLAGYAYSALCNPAAAVASFRRASAIEPLQADHQSELANVLASMGRDEEAEAVARRIPDSAGAPWRASSLASIALYRGDLSRSIVQGMLAENLARHTQFERRETNVALAFDVLGDTERALAHLRERDREIAAYWRGDFRAVARSAGDADLTRTTMVNLVVAKSLLRVGDTRRLLQLYDRAFSSPARADEGLICYLPGWAPTLVLALRRGGRAQEADQILGLAEARLRQAASAGFARAPLHANESALRLLRGDRNGALAILARAVDEGWLAHTRPFVTLDEPVFDPVRNDPRFGAIERRMAAAIARERRELAAEQAAVLRGRS